MNASKTRRALAALLALCITPAPALAQSTSLGIVSAVSGVANVVRAGRQDAQPVQFKDNVFLKDLIRTGDKGLVRLLMGGKAVITVREFTNLTITDDPGRPTVIELTQGKIAVGVARARMKPGESIEVHTPNAIAGVRGTFLVVEVDRGRTAQLGGGIAGITTNVHVISGLVNVQAGGQQTNVGGLQTVSATGNNLGQLRTLSANEASSITRTYNPSPQNSAPDQHTSAPPRAALVNLVEGHQQQFQQLARALSGAPEPFDTKFDKRLKDDKPGRDVITDQDLNPTKKELIRTLIGSSPLTFPRGPIDTNERFTSMVLRSGEELSGIGTVKIDGPSSWTGGSMTGTGTTTLEGGTFITGTDLSLEHGRTVEFRSPTVFDGTVSISTDTHAKIENHDLITKTGAGAATIASGILFDNHGTINIVAGTFDFHGSGTHGSTFTGGGTLVFGGGTQTFNSNSTISTANTILYGGGALAGTGVLTVTGGFDWQDGTMTGPGITRLQGPTTIAGGGSRHLDLGRTLSLEGTSTLDGSLTTTVGSGTVRFTAGTHTIDQTATISTTHTILSGGTITGTGLLTVTGALDWQTGIMDGWGTTQLLGPTTISSADHKFLTNGRTLLLHGPTSFTDGVLALAGGAVVQNTGTLTIAGDVNLVALDTGTLRNTGTIVKTSGGGLTTIGGLVGALTFNNEGTVDVQAGRIKVGADGTHSGLFNVDAGRTLAFAGGTHQMNAGTRFTGAGEIEVDGAIVNVAIDDVHQMTGPLRVSNGALNVNGSLVSKTSGQWASPTGTILDVTGGTLTTTGSIVSVSPGGSVATIGSGFDLVSIAGTGTHDVSTTSSMFDVTGTNTTILNVLGLIVLTLGTDTPLQHDGVLLAKSGPSTLNTSRLMKLDTALFEASKPLMTVFGGTVNAGNDLVHLLSNAKLNGNAGLLPTDALVKVNNATVNVAGSAFNVANGSHLNVAGNLLYLSNSSTFNVASGSLVSVSNGSVFSLSNGSLASFGGLGTNSLNITNTAALCGGCSITTSILNLAGVPVLLKNGATALNVLVNAGFQPFAGLSGSNTVNVSGPSGAVLTVDGINSKVKLGF
jgi:hypothetical protein